MRSGYQSMTRIAILVSFAVVVGFVLYAQSLREDTSIPPGPAEVAGRILMEKKRCVRCHMISGSGGMVGPNLTLVALRLGEARMLAILEDPKAVNPKAKMPKPRLTPEQRAVIVRYLRTLDGASPALPPAPPAR